MTYQYQRRLNPFKAGKAATTTRVLKRPPGMKAEAKPFGEPLEEAMEHYAKRSKYGSESIAGIKYADIHAIPNIWDKEPK